MELEGGYELVVKSIDIDGNRVYLELYKDKEMIDSRIIVPANQVDDEFVYSRPGTSNEIRAKLKNSFRSAYQNLATIVGIWQNSEDNPDRILINKSQLIILSSKESIKLEEGYELFIKSMDIEGDKICLELDKDGKLVHEEVIIPPNDVDDIFHYSRAGTSHEILIHFKNVLRTPDQDLVTIDRIWQNSKDNPDRILINDSRSMTLSSQMPLELQEGYELAIRFADIEGNKAYLQFSRDGEVIDSKLIIPANEVDDNFVYSQAEASNQIKVHFKNAYRGTDHSLAMIDGIWQTSGMDPYRILINDTQLRTVSSRFGLMLEEGYELEIQSMDLDGNRVYVVLVKDGEIVASQVIMPANEGDDTFIYSCPGTPQEIRVRFKNAFRGADQNLATADGLWQTSEVNPDLILIDDPRSRTMTSGTTLALEEGYKLAINSIDIDGNKVNLDLYKDEIVIDSQVIIPANEVDDTFIYSCPGTSQEIRVRFKNAFRGADQSMATVDSLWQTSEIDPNPILINDTRSQTITSGTPLKLEEGYELIIPSIDIDGNKLYLELCKDGMVVDSQVITPENEVDDTFIYSRPETSQKIKVHFKNAFRGAEQSLVTIDSISQ